MSRLRPVITRLTEAIAVVGVETRTSPRVLDVEPGAVLAVGKSGGDVKQPVAQCLDLGQVAAEKQ